MGDDGSTIIVQERTNTANWAESDLVIFHDTVNPDYQNQTIENLRVTGTVEEPPGDEDRDGFS